MSNSNRYLLGRNALRQWILVWQQDKNFAWSGSRWVPIGLEPGNVTVQQ